MPMICFHRLTLNGAQTHETIRGGQLGGVVGFFDENATKVIILSSLSQFMVANLEVNEYEGTPVLNYGLMGSVQVRIFIQVYLDRNL